MILNETVTLIRNTSIKSAESILSAFDFGDDFGGGGGNGFHFSFGGGNHGHAERPREKRNNFFTFEDFFNVRIKYY